jgi:hypothetical protein
MSTCALPHRHDPHRPRPALYGLLVCPGHYDGLRAQLAGEPPTADRPGTTGIAGLWAALAAILPPGAAAGGARVAGTREPALPFRPVVADHRRAIADLLADWAVHLSGRPLTTTHPGRVAHWITDRLEVAAADPTIGDYATRLDQARRRALALLDPVVRRRVAVGFCADTGTGCPGLLGADVVVNDTALPSVIRCTECDAEWPPHRWLELGRRIGQKATRAA